MDQHVQVEKGGCEIVYSPFDAFFLKYCDGNQWELRLKRVSRAKAVQREAKERQ